MDFGWLRLYRIGACGGGATASDDATVRHTDGTAGLFPVLGDSPVAHCPSRDEPASPIAAGGILPRNDAVGRYRSFVYTGKIGTHPGRSRLGFGHPPPVVAGAAGILRVRMLPTEFSAAHWQQRGEQIPGGGWIARLPGPVCEVPADDQRSRVVGAEDPLHGGQQRSTKVPGGGWVARDPGPVGEFIAIGQSVRMVWAEDPRPRRQ